MPMRRGLSIAFIAVLLSARAVAGGSGLSPEQAAQHMGERATVCGRVASTRYASSAEGQPTFINLGKAYPDEVFTIVIWGDDRARFSVPPETWHGSLCVTGKIASYQGEPQIEVSDPAQVQRSQGTRARAVGKRPTIHSSNDRLSLPRLTWSDLCRKESAYETRTRHRPRAISGAGAIPATGCSEHPTVTTLAASAALIPVQSSHPRTYRLVQYPNASRSGFYAQTEAARHSIDMEMYELTDAREEARLIAAARRGVRVRVLLDRAWHGQEVNTNAYDALSSHGVAVKWAPASAIYHIKTTTFDHTTSDISTANLTRRYYATDRDATIIDRNPSQVAAIEQTFDHDWNSPNREGTAIQASGLVWSPGAQPSMVEQIKAARRSVYFMSEELSDSAVYDALASDARRGIRCAAVMNASPTWHTAFRTLTQAGCHVRVYPRTRTGLYIHEKFVLDDAGTPAASVMIGSQNASGYSLNRNRELSVILTQANAPVILHAVGTTFLRDYRNAVDWHNRPS
ncbi:MAG: phospholipase D-like domain-containing protein [Rhodanobacteraceae bacterium]